MRKLLIVLGCLLITACGEVPPHIPNPPTPRPEEPKPENDSPRLEEPPPPTSPAYSASCSDNPEMAELENFEANVYEIWMACLVKNHDKQRRATMSYHPILGKVARSRADDLALHEWPEPHVDSSGYGPNYYVCILGYKASFCPAGDTDNMIESLSGGLEPDPVLRGWLNSPGHRAHVLAENDFFAEQVYYGVGYAYVTLPPSYEDAIGVWVIITVDPPLE